MSWAVFSTILAATLLSGPAHAESPVERGKYLASFSSCDHCHTSGYFFRKPDVSQRFSCSDIGFKVGELGIFVGPNLSSDKETGRGGRTDEQIATALTPASGLTVEFLRRSCRGVQPNQTWPRSSRICAACRRRKIRRPASSGHTRSRLFM